MSNVVPQSWELRSLGDLAKKIEGGGTPPRNEPNYWNGSIPWATVKDLRGVSLTSTEESISASGLKNSSSRLIDANTMIIATRMAVGKAVYFDSPVAINQDLKALYPEDDVDWQFLLHWYLSKADYIESLATGSTVKGIRLEDLRALPIKLPPLPEQQKIATILSSVDDVIEKTREQIDKLKDLKTGMMQELLAKGIGHTEFKDSPIGRIPANWQTVTLGALIDRIDSGVSVNGENRVKGPNEIGVLKVSSISKGAFYPLEHKTVLSAEINRAKVNPLKDRILFSRANTPSLVGESAYIDRFYPDLFLSDKIWMLDVNDRNRVHLKWLSYILCSGRVRTAISDVATGTSSSMKNISKRSLLAITIPFPNLGEQVKIASTIQTVDNMLYQTSEMLATTKLLKKALMQDLLTAKVRVNVENKEPAVA